MAETRIVTLSVTANSRNSRPTISPMNNSGINTAISDTLSDTIVKPISSEPAQGGLQRRFALFDVTGDVLDHHDRVVDDEAGRDRQRHQRQVVQAVAQHVHHGEGADQRQRHRHAGNDRGRQVAQEQENHQHHQANGQHQLELHVFHAGADRHGAVGEDRNLDGSRQAGFQPRQQRLDPLDDVDDVGPRLPLDVDDHGGLRRPSRPPAAGFRCRRSRRPRRSDRPAGCCDKR